MLDSLTKTIVEQCRTVIVRKINEVPKKYFYIYNSQDIKFLRFCIQNVISFLLIKNSPIRPKNLQQFKKIKY